MTWRPAHLVLICRVKSLRNVNFFLADILGDTITPYNVSKRPRSVLRFFSFSFSNVASCLLGWRPRTTKPSRRWCSSSVEVWSPLISSHKWESLLSYCHNCPYELEEIKPRLCHHPWSQSHSTRTVIQMLVDVGSSWMKKPHLFARLLQQCNKKKLRLQYFLPKL